MRIIAPANLFGCRFVVCVLVATMLAAVAAEPAIAQSVTPASIPVQRELVIGTKEAPPFAIKNRDGSWSGISIELWRRVADEMKLPYRLVEEQTVQGLIDGTAAGKFDAAVAALTVTPARAKLLDFTQSFYVTGLGIAVPAGASANWWPVLRAMTSPGFLQAVLGLIGLALGAGILVWLFERRHNESYGRGLKGFSSSVWWSTAAMTQRGAAHMAPQTVPGRVVAIFWMVVSIVAIAVFTAGLTSALTIKQLQGNVHGVADLSTVRVGAVAGTSTEELLSRFRVRYRAFANAHDGLRALRSGDIDAFVYDRPLLAWVIQQDFRSSVQLLDATFDHQAYAIALPNGSALRKPLDVAVLNAVQDGWWEQALFRYLGGR